MEYLSNGFGPKGQVFTFDYHQCAGEALGDISKVK